MVRIKAKQDSDEVLVLSKKVFVVHGHDDLEGV